MEAEKKAAEAKMQAEKKAAEAKMEAEKKANMEAEKLARKEREDDEERQRQQQACWDRIMRSIAEKARQQKERKEREQKDRELKLLDEVCFNFCKHSLESEPHFSGLCDNENLMWPDGRDCTLWLEPNKIRNENNRPTHSCLLRLNHWYW